MMKKENVVLSYLSKLLPFKGKAIVNKHQQQEVSKADLIQRDAFKAIREENLSEVSESIAQHTELSISKQFTLYTPFAQKVYKRTERGTKQAFYQTDVLMPLYYQKQLDLVIVMDKLLTGELEKVQTDLKNDISRLKGMLESANMSLENDVNVNYAHKQGYVVEVSSPKQGLYLSIVTDYDYYVRLMDVLCLHRFMETHVRSTQVFNWQSRIIKMANRCVHTQTSIRKALMNNTASQDRQKILKEIAASLGQEFFDKVFGKENKQ